MIQKLKATIDINVMSKEQFEYEKDGEKVQIKDLFVVTAYQDHQSEFLKLMCNEKIYKQIKPTGKAKVDVYVHASMNGKFLKDSIKIDKIHAVA